MADETPTTTPADQEQRQLACVRLNLVKGIGPILFGRLVEAFDGDISRIFRSSPATIADVERIGRRTAREILDPQYERLAREELTRANDAGITLLTWHDDDYPEALHHLPDPPMVLYVRGTLLPTDRVAVGIVGSRQASYYGREQARRFGGLLAGSGYTVVSGFARGIDTEAHRGALQARGRTLGIIGSGLLDIYPAENEPMVADVAAHGALISEFPLTYPPSAQNFPRRNRIIAGLSLGVLVVEAGLKSGSLITARFAHEYGREVFAVPGKIDTEASRGCHRLIRDGAALVETLADIVEALGPIGEVYDGIAERSRTRDLWSQSEPAAEKPSTPTPTATTPPLHGDEGAVFAVLSGEPMPLDHLLQRCDLPLPRVSAALTMLELKGLARQLAGKQYLRAQAFR